MFLSKPEYWPALRSLLIPSRSIIANPDMLYIAVGMLGATVMPHNLYLHSSIVQSRRYPRTPEGKREAVWMANIDSALALTVALFVNAAILIVAAAVFHRSGHFEVAAIEDAYKLLSPLVGTVGASTLFAVALLASGQNSSITGTLAGQVVMEGFIHIKLSPWVAPADYAIHRDYSNHYCGGDHGEEGTEKLLLLSQVILSLQLSFRGGSAGADYGKPQEDGRICECAVAEGAFVGLRGPDRGFERLGSCCRWCRASKGCAWGGGNPAP